LGIPATLPLVTASFSLGYKERRVSVADIYTTLNISRATLYRYLALEAKDTKEEDR